MARSSCAGNNNWDKQNHFCIHTIRLQTTMRKGLFSKKRNKLTKTLSDPQLDHKPQRERVYIFCKKTHTHTENGIRDVSGTANIPDY